jgi:hypothetical protein
MTDSLSLQSHEVTSAVLPKAWDSYLRCDCCWFRFKARALELVVLGLRQVHFSHSSVQQQEFMRCAEALLEQMKRAKQDSQQQQQQQRQWPEPRQLTPPAWSSQEEE